VQVGRRSLPVETRIPLDYFETGDRLGSYAQMRELCQANPLISWAAYIGGSIFTLLKEEAVTLRYGFNLLLLSAVPMNVGIGSSATAEIATLHCLQTYLRLNLNAARLAQLGQIAENQVVGAPCGIMDQISVTSGKDYRLIHILCRPGRIIGDVEIPQGTGFVGINSMVKHSVAGPYYTDVRIGAFIGKRIINHHRATLGQSPVNYLTEVSASDFESQYRALLPEKIIGSEFLAGYRSHDDPVTTVLPDGVYGIVGPTAHPIYENERVLRFIQALQDARDGNEKTLETAGEQMYLAHESYKSNCNLSCDEVDLLVESVRKRGAAKGLYGAKITGGGSGGTVAVFGKIEALKQEIPAIVQEYQRRTGLSPDVFEGTSPGALQFGAVRYRFGANGWRMHNENP
jgi:L-arabinokinase